MVRDAPGRESRKIQCQWSAPRKLYFYVCFCMLYFYVTGSKCILCGGRAYSFRANTTRMNCVKATASTTNDKRAKVLWLV